MFNRACVALALVGLFAASGCIFVGGHRHGGYSRGYGYSRSSTVVVHRAPRPTTTVVVHRSHCR